MKKSNRPNGVEFVVITSKTLFLSPIFKQIYTFPDLSMYNILAGVPLVNINSSGPNFFSFKDFAKVTKKS